MPIHSIFPIYSNSSPRPALLRSAPRIVQAQEQLAVNDLAMAKLRRINQGLRTGLSDATSGWRSSILLSKQMTQKCEDLEASVEKMEREAEKSREEVRGERLR